MGRIRNKILALMLVTAMALAGAAGTADLSTVSAADTSDTSTWMSNVDGSAKLSAITIPGTHDSCTQYVSLSYIFRCQDTNISQQLENGYRYLDIRAVIDEKDGQPALIIKHNFAKCRKESWIFSDKLYLDDVFDMVYSFLEENPTETVIIAVKAENSDDDVSQVQQLLYEQIDQNLDKWYTANTIPTLDEVRGKAVLATRFEDELGVGEMRSGLNFQWVDQGNKDIADEASAISMINENESLWVQDRYKYATSDKIEAVVETLENCQADDTNFSLNFTSTSGSGYAGHPKKYATQINDYLLSYDWQAETCYGIVIVDFANADLAECIYSTNKMD